MAKYNTLKTLELLYLRKQISKKDYLFMKKDYENLKKHRESQKERGKKANVATIQSAIASFKKPSTTNQVIIAHIEKVNNIKKPILESPESIAACGETYFKLCYKDGVKPSPAGLALAIGVSRLTLLNWASGNSRLQNSEVIANLLQRCETFMVSSMMAGTVNPVPGLFFLKNNHGYKDESTIKVDSKDKQLTDDELRKKYIERGSIIDADFTEKDKDKKDGQ